MQLGERFIGPRLQHVIYASQNHQLYLSLLRNRSAVPDAAAWRELMSMIHHRHGMLDKSSSIKTGPFEGRANYNASFSWQKQPSCEL